MARRAFVIRAGVLLAPFLWRAGAAVAYDDRECKFDRAYPGMIVRQRDPDNLEFPLPALDGFVTANERFFVRSHFATPTIDARDWRLTVDGLVSRPLSLSYAELLQMPSRSLYATLECAGNSRVYLVPKVRGVSWGLGAVSNAEWTGVPLSLVLERAGVAASAVDVVFEGADAGEVKEEPVPSGKIHFARGLPLAMAMSPDVLLAYKMNGEDLPRSHGFPLRLIVPGWYGMASVKWLNRISLIDRPFAGYFQSVDYAYWERLNGVPVRVPIGPMQVKSEIARPATNEVVAVGSRYKVVGVAWTGGADVSAVSVSTDGGASWSPARLKGEPVRHVWSLWEYDWQVPAKPGLHVLMSRAVDSSGRQQPDRHDFDRGNYMINFTLPVPVLVQ